MEKKTQAARKAKTAIKQSNGNNECLFMGPKVVNRRRTWRWKCRWDGYGYGCHDEETAAMPPEMTP